MTYNDKEPPRVIGKRLGVLLKGLAEQSIKLDCEKDSKVVKVNSFQREGQTMLEITVMHTVFADNAGDSYRNREEITLSLYPVPAPGEKGNFIYSGGEFVDTVNLQLVGEWKPYAVMVSYPHKDEGVD